jgi:hypothetical protein
MELMQRVTLTPLRLAAVAQKIWMVVAGRVFLDVVVPLTKKVRNPKMTGNFLCEISTWFPTLRVESRQFFSFSWGNSTVNGPN